MRRIRISPRVSACIFFAFFLTTILASASDVLQSSTPKRADAVSAQSATQESAVAERYADLPLSFEANRGQTDGTVRFLSRGAGYSFFLTQTGATLTFAPDAQPKETAFHMQLAGANPNARIQGMDELPGKSNYFFGSDSGRWFTGVPTYSKVAYENIYPGINLVYYGNQRQLEYDFVVSPGADPQQIQLSVSGAQNVSIDAQGNLALHSSSGDVQLLAPKVYQLIHGSKQQVSGQWTLLAEDVAAFRLGTYDRTQPLVIDPVLMYSSFLGGSQKNSLSKIAIDKAGNAYVAGYTASGDFRTAPTPMAVTFGNGRVSRGAFVAKIDPTGKSMLYSTYLSGNIDEEATGLAIDSAGAVYVAGTTHSPDFPTVNALQTACATHTQAGTCSSAFLTKISPNGSSLVFSTYLGGSGEETARGLAVDAKGSAYVIGITSSPDFPVTTGVAQSKCAGTCQQSAFLAKFNPSGDALAFATYLGGSGLDDAADIALDVANNVYVAGKTTSPDFPTVAPFQKSCIADAASSSGACLATAFVTKVKADGSAFSYSTYLGGSLGSQATAIAVDKLGSAYVTGSTKSPDFPVLKAYQKSCAIDKVAGGCSVDAFLTKLSPSGKALVYSTYLGGSGIDEPFGIAVDASNQALVIGRTTSPDFPTSAPLQKALKGTSDAFIARFNPAGSALNFSTYHGGSATESAAGIALDGKGNVYVTGQTTSADFPTHNAFQTSCAGTCASAFVSKISVPLVSSAPTITSPDNISFLANTASTFTVTTTGSPTPAIDDGGATLPGSITFTDNHDGTGTLAGTPPNAASTTNFTFTASNGVSPDATQPFTLNVCNGSVSLPDLSGVFADASNLGGGTFSVTIDNTCAWTSSTDSPAFLSISGGATGNGGGTFGVSNYTNAGASGSTRTGNLIIVGNPNPVTQFPVGITLSQTTGTSPVEAGQTATYTAAVTKVSVANQGVTFTLTQGGNPCSPGCGTVNSANPVTYTAPASTDPATPPGPVTLTATSTFDNTRIDTTIINVSDYTISLSSISGSVTQGQSVSPAVTVTGAALNGYTGTLTFGCVVAPTPANAPTCSVPSVTIPGAGKAATISTVGATPTGPYTVTITATDAKGVSHAKTFSLTVDPAPVLSVAKSVGGAFTQGGTGTWNIDVSNTAAGSNTTAGLQVTDNLSAGFSLSSFSGTGWSCSGTNSVTCTSTSTVAGGSAYPTLSLTVNVPKNAKTVSNTATASGGTALSSANGSDNNVSITQVPSSLVATSGGGQSVPVGNNFAAFSATVTDAGSNPIQNVPVTFTAPSSGASCSFGGLTSTTVNSDVNGVATTTTACTANATHGAYNITASVTTAGVPKPTFAVTNTDFSLAFSPTSADVAPGASPSGVTLNATALNGYAPTSLTVSSCVVTATNPSGLTPVPTCGVGPSITVGTPAPVTFTTTGSPAGSYTFTATVHDSSTNAVQHTAPLTLNLVQVTISTVPPTTLEVNQTIPFSGSTAGLPGDSNVKWSVDNTNCGSNCGNVSPSGPNTGTNYSSPSTTQSGVAVAIKATSDGDANFSQTSASFLITDYSVSLPTAPVVITQGGSTLSTLTAAGINSYAGAINTTPCGITPSSAGSPTCSVSSPTVPGTSNVNVQTTASTAVGLYNMTVVATDAAATPVSHTTSVEQVAVQCSLSLQQVVPTFVPAQGASDSLIPNQFSFGVSVVQGGTACPYGNAGVVGAGAPSAVSGDGNAVTTIATGSSGTASASQPGTVTFEINPNFAGTTATLGSVSMGSFDATQASMQTQLAMPVMLEANVSLTAGLAATTNVTLNTTTPPAGTLNVVNVGASTGVCGVVGANGSDATGDVSCTAQVSGSTIQLSIAVSATAAASNRGRSPIMLLSYALGFPAIVFLGAGLTAFGPKGKRQAVRNGTTWLALILLMTMLLVVPGCGGGFIPPKINKITGSNRVVTVMAYFTDASGNVIRIEVFTVPLNIA